ncbi:MAG TPA: hypothetical protein VHT50_31805 [Mycobacterium sp.]|nr:hypothetical protein [Mycobacterium sp.]
MKQVGLGAQGERKGDVVGGHLRAAQGLVDIPYRDMVGYDGATTDRVVVGVADDGRLRNQIGISDQREGMVEVLPPAFMPQPPASGGTDRVCHCHRRGDDVAFRSLVTSGRVDDELTPPQRFVHLAAQNLNGRRPDAKRDGQQRITDGLNADH